MTLEELEKIFKEVDDGKKQVIRTMFPDFLYEHRQLELLKPKLEQIGVPKNKVEAEKKRVLTKEYVDLSQRHDSKIKIFLSALSKFEGSEEHPISVWLRERKQND